MPFGPIVNAAGRRADAGADAGADGGRDAGSGARPKVLVVGASSRDITSGDPRGWRLGGAVTYGSLTLARLGLRVRALVGADVDAAGASELTLLREAGVEVALARLERGPVFENIEGPGGRRQVCLQVSDPVELAALPDGWRTNGGLFLGPVAGELDASWATVGAAMIALGWQGLLRRLVAGADVEHLDPAPHSLLAAADLVGVSTDDVGDETPLRKLVDLVRPGSTLVVTRGDRGGTVLTSRRPARSGLRAYPAIPSNGVVDATGAGDVFLASLLATGIIGPRLDAEGWAERLTFAAAAGSLAVEGPGLLGVPTLAGIRRRILDVA